MFTPFRLCIAFLGIVSLMTWTLIGFAAPKKASVNKEAKATFASSCAMCHGADGSGTPLGKSLQVADLRSPEVQSAPTAQLIAAVANGKRNMPPFKDKLAARQIADVIDYVRTLGNSKAK